MKPRRPRMCLLAFGVCLLPEPTEPSASPSPPPAVVFPPWTHPPDHFGSSSTFGSRTISNTIVVETQVWQPGVGWTSSQWCAPDGAPSLSPVELNSFEHTDGWAWCGEWAVEESATVTNKQPGNASDLESGAGVDHSCNSSDTIGLGDEKEDSEDFGRGDGWCYSAPTDDSKDSLQFDERFRWRRWKRPMRPLMTFSQHSKSDASYNLEAASSSNSAISTNDGGIRGRRSSTTSSSSLNSIKGSGFVRSPLQPHTRLASNDDIADDVTAESSPARALQLDRSEGPTWVDTLRDASFAPPEPMQREFELSPVQKPVPQPQPLMPQTSLPRTPLIASTESSSTDLKSAGGTTDDGAVSSEILKSQAQRELLSPREDVASQAAAAAPLTATPAAAPITAEATAPRTSALPEAAPPMAAVTSAPKRSSEERRLRKWAARLRRDFTFTGFVLAWGVPLRCPQMCGPFLRLKLGHCFQSWALNEKLPLVTLHAGINKGKVFAFCTLAYRVDTYLSAIDWIQQHNFMSRRYTTSMSGSSSSSTRTSNSDGVSTAASAAGALTADISPSETPGPAVGVVLGSSATVNNVYASPSTPISNAGASHRNPVGGEGNTEAMTLQLGGGYQPGSTSGSTLNRPLPHAEPPTAVIAAVGSAAAAVVGNSGGSVGESGHGMLRKAAAESTIAGSPSLASPLPHSSARSTNAGNQVSGGMRRGLGSTGGASSGSTCSSSGSSNDNDAHPTWASPQRKLAFQLSYVGCSFGMKYEWFSEKHGAVLAPRWAPFNGVWVSAWPYAEDVLRTAARALPINHHSARAGRAALRSFLNRHRRSSTRNNQFTSGSGTTSSSSSYAETSPNLGSNSLTSSAGADPLSAEAAASTLHHETAAPPLAAVLSPSSKGSHEGVAAAVPTAVDKTAALLFALLERPWQLWLSWLATKLCQLGGAVHCKSDEGFGGVAAFQLSPVFFGLPFVNWPRARAAARAQFRAATPPHISSPPLPLAPPPVSPPPLSTPPSQATSSTMPPSTPSSRNAAEEAASPLPSSDAPTFYNVAWPKRSGTYVPRGIHEASAAAHSEPPLSGPDAVHNTEEAAAPLYQPVHQEQAAMDSSPGFKNVLTSGVQASKATNDGTSLEGTHVEGPFEAADISQAQRGTVPQEEGSHRIESHGPQRINAIPGLPAQELDATTRNTLPLPAVQDQHHRSDSTGEADVIPLGGALSTYSGRARCGQ